MTAIYYALITFYNRFMNYTTFIEMKQINLDYGIINKRTRFH